VRSLQPGHTYVITQHTEFGGRYFCRGARLTYVASHICDDGSYVYHFSRLCGKFELCTFDSEPSYLDLIPFQLASMPH